MTLTRHERPDSDATYTALLRVSDLLGDPRCWIYQRRFHFNLGDGWTLAFSDDSAGRFRLEACKWTRPRVTLWTFVDDSERLAGLVRELTNAVGVQQGV